MIPVLAVAIAFGLGILVGILLFYWALVAWPGPYERPPLFDQEAT